MSKNTKAMSWTEQTAYIERLLGMIHTLQASNRKMAAQIKLLSNQQKQ